MASKRFAALRGLGDSGGCCRWPIASVLDDFIACEMELMGSPLVVGTIDTRDRVCIWMIHVRVGIRVGVLASKRIAMYEYAGLCDAGHMQANWSRVETRTRLDNTCTSTYSKPQKCTYEMLVSSDSSPPSHNPNPSEYWIPWAVGRRPVALAYSHVFPGPCRQEQPIAKRHIPEVSWYSLQVGTEYM